MEEPLQALKDVVGRSGFAVLDVDNLLKLEPIISISELVSQVESLLLQGDASSAINYLKALEDPEAFVMRGQLFCLKKGMTTESFERKLKGEVEKKYAAQQGTVQKAYEALISIYSEVSPQEIRQLSQRGIGFWIMKAEKSSRQALSEERRFKSYTVFAVKHVPSYQVMVKTSGVEGVWQFPECFLGVQLDVAGSEHRIAVSDEMVGTRIMRFVPWFLR